MIAACALAEKIYTGSMFPITVKPFNFEAVHIFLRFCNLGIFTAV